MPTPDFRTILATRTRAAHAHIEALLALDAAAPLERYIAYLRAMHAVIAAVERGFSTGPALEALGMPMSARKSRLERDLAHFGAPTLAATIALPEGMAARVGWLYVLEGSALGGRVLLKRLGARWTLTQDEGGAFLAGNGARTGQEWTRFVQSLNDIPFDAAERKACVAGARQAFQAIEECFRASVAGGDLRLGLHARDGPASR